MEVRIVLLGIIFLIAGCGGPDFEDIADQIESDTRLLSSEMGTLEELKNLCLYGRENQREVENARALAEWDRVIADSIPNMSEAAKERARIGVAKELGILPHEANGWANVLEGRAKASESDLKRLEGDRLSLDEQKESCVRYLKYAQLVASGMDDNLKKIERYEGEVIKYYKDKYGDYFRYGNDYGSNVDKFRKEVHVMRFFLGNYEDNISVVEKKRSELVGQSK